MSLRAGSVKHNSSDDEKAQPNFGQGVVETYNQDAEDPLEENEVFKKTHEGVNFRTVGWPRASVIFLKGMTLLGFRHMCRAELIDIQSSSQPVCSQFLPQCIPSVHLVVLFQSSAGESSTPTLVSFRAISATRILDATLSPTCVMSWGGSGLKKLWAHFS